MSDSLPKSVSSGEHRDDGAGVVAVRMSDSLPKSVSKLVNWNLFFQEFTGLGYRNADVPLPPPPPMDEGKKAFRRSTEHLVAGIKEAQRREYIGMAITAIPAVISMFSPVVGAATNQLLGFGVAVGGQAVTFATLYYQSIQYMRGAEKLRTFLAISEAAEDVCTTPQEHQQFLTWFLSEATRLQPT